MNRRDCFHCICTATTLPQIVERRDNCFSAVQCRKRHTARQRRLLLHQEHSGGTKYICFFTHNSKISCCTTQLHHTRPSPRSRDIVVFVAANRLPPLITRQDKTFTPEAYIATTVGTAVVLHTRQHGRTKRTTAGDECASNASAALITRARRNSGPRTAPATVTTTERQRPLLVTARQRHFPVLATVTDYNGSVSCISGNVPQSLLRL